MNSVLRIFFLICTTGSSAVDYRIIGGRPANESEFPYQISLRKSYNDDHFCGGTLVSPNHILTVAHCMYYVWGGVLPPVVVSAVAGQLDLPITSASVFRNATTIIIHPEYNSTLMSNDIAIIEVDQPFPININPQIDIVPVRNATVGAGQCIVTGWGVEKIGSDVVSDILLAAEVEIVDLAQCSNMYNATLSQGMMCAGHKEGKTDSCQGDSGGPLVCNGLLTGLVSSGSGCGSADFPGIYTDVASYYTWIRSIIGDSTDTATTTDDIRMFTVDNGDVQSTNDTKDFVTNGGFVNLILNPFVYFSLFIILSTLTFIL